MKKYLNEDTARLILGLIVFLLSLLVSDELIKLALTLVAYCTISLEIFKNALKNGLNGEIFDENSLMIIATIGAFIIKCYDEAFMVMFLYCVGEFLSDLAVDKSKDSIIELMDLKAEKTNLLTGENKIKIVDTSKVKEGDIFVVKPGEKIPLDGVVVKGESHVDTSSLTGESVPRKVELGTKVLSGCINIDSVLEIEAISTSKTSTTAKIMEIIENSGDAKSKTEKFITKFARIYTPIVVIIGAAIFFIPGYLTGHWSKWLYRGLVFLVTSCPCALVLSVPLGYFCGIGAASKVGAIVKGSSELESLTDLDYIVLDKTGTITEGVFEVTKIHSKKKKEEFMKLVASAEFNSIHPIANAIVKYNEKNNNNELLPIEKYQEISGKGIRCFIDHKELLVGNHKLMKDNNIEIAEVDEIGSVVHAAYDDEYLGYVVISDKIKKSSKRIKDLKYLVTKDLVMLSGDSNKVVEHVAKEVGIKKYFGELLPTDKVEKVIELKKDNKVLFVGDGINDAPVIKLADVGVSMGGIGSDAAIEASDIVLMNDSLETLEKTIKIAMETKRKVSSSIIFALSVKFIILLLGLFGISTIWMAVFADVGVTLLSVLFVLTIYIKNKK